MSDVADAAIQREPAGDGAAGVDLQFRGKDERVRAIHGRILTAACCAGSVRGEPKKSFVQLAQNTAFAGVHPRRSYRYLNLKTDPRIESKRIAKVEPVSEQRFHNALKIRSPDDMGAELTGWLLEAYALGDATIAPPL